jgi:hypothetical protein
MSKTNREKNTAYDRSQADRIRPKQPNWNFEPLEQVIRQWVKARVESEQT